MKIRVVTWNMAYWSHKKFHGEAWDYLLNTIDADFVLVQEAKIPDTLKDEDNFLWHNAGETPGRRDWGTGIYSKKYKITQELSESIQSWNKYRSEELCIVANAQVDGGKALTLISLYGRMDKVGNDVYCITNLHRILSDLTGIFNGHFGKRNIILGGDLNATEQLDPIQGNSSHGLFFKRLEDFKLSNCYKLKGNTDFVQTHRHNVSKMPWQNDYFFISNTMSKSFVDCEVIDNEDVRRLSDHNPVVITLDI